MKHRWIIFAIFATMCAAASGSTTWWYLHRNPFPASIRQYATTPLYFPTHLPPGFTLNHDSFSQKRGVTLYNFNAPDSNKLNFTVQKVPANYNFEQLNGSTMEDTKTIATPLGTAHIGMLGENTMANLVTGDTWIMAVYSQPNAIDDLATIMKSLKRY